MNEPLITDEDIEALKSHDSRWRDVDHAIKLDEELRDSFTVNLILESLTRRSTEAMERLITADPTDVKRISALQEQVNSARYIGLCLNLIRERGLSAQQLLEEEGNIELEELNGRG